MVDVVCTAQDLDVFALNDGRREATIGTLYEDTYNACMGPSDLKLLPDPG